MVASPYTNQSWVNQQLNNTSAELDFNKKMTDLYAKQGIQHIAAVTGGDINNGYGSNSGSGSGSAMGTSDYLSMASGAQDLAKQMAEFQLGINDKQAQQDYYYRNLEDTREFSQQKDLNKQQFGQQYALQGQQITGQKDLTQMQQGAETSRLGMQLDTQKSMQQADFNNQTQQRAQAAALAQLGFNR